MKTLHTPGPWKIRNIPWNNGDKQLQIVAEHDPRPEYCAATAVVAITPRYNLQTGQFDQSMADARLIEQAPEMYKALHDLIYGPGLCGNEPWRQECLRSAIAKASAVLAKVEGGTDES